MVSHLRRIKVSYCVLILIIFLLTVIRIIFLHLYESKTYIDYLPQNYRDLVKSFLDQPIYLEELFKQENTNYKQFGNFGLLWEVNKTFSECPISNGVDYTENQNVPFSTLFSGDKIREFNHTRIKYKGTKTLSIHTANTRDEGFGNRFNCTKWGVVTTIFEPPSEAVRRFLYRKHWCVVVIGDKGMPTKVGIFILEKKIRVLILVIFLRICSDNILIVFFF